MTTTFKRIKQPDTVTEIRARLFTLRSHGAHRLGTEECELCQERDRLEEKLRARDSFYTKATEDR